MFPILVCGILIVTVMPVIVQLGKIPATATLLTAPAGLLSGTGMLTVPEQNCVNPIPLATLSFTAGSPRHILTDGGVTTGAGGV